MSLLMLSGILQYIRQREGVGEISNNTFHSQLADDLLQIALRDLSSDNLHHSLADVADLAGLCVARLLDLVGLPSREPNAEHPQ